MKKKKCGYYYRLNRQLKKLCKYPNIICAEDLRQINPKRRRWIIAHWFEFRYFFVMVLFLACNCFSFQGVGDCQKLLEDYAQLTKKSVFLPHLLDGNCVVQNEKHLPLILKNAGFNYQEKNGYIQIKPIIPLPEKPKEEWQPEDKYYNVEFVFINMSNAVDCGFKMDDIFFRLRNIDYSFSLGMSLGCPALDYDGSFAFRTNAHLIENWTYSHGIEQQRQHAQITSSTGAVTNEYEWVTTGLNLTLSQTKKGVSFSLKYTGRNGSVTTSSGGIVDEVKATVTDEFTRTRKFWLIPIGRETLLATYTLFLRIVPSNPNP